MKAVCEALGVARSNVHARTNRPEDWQDRRRGRTPSRDEALAAELRQEIAELPSYGYRRAGALVNRTRRINGRPGVNHKRVYRVMREHGLLLSRHQGRPPDTRAHDGRIAVDASDVRWCSDGFEISCQNRERVRIAFALDCCDREVMSWVATTGGIDGNMIRDLMLEALEKRFGADRAPGRIQWLSDNGSPYVAKDTRRFARELGLEPVTTALRSPQSNGMAEAFVKTFKRDYVARMDLSNASVAMAHLAAAFEHYNEIHPHSALKLLSPRQFRRISTNPSNVPCPVT